MADTPCVYADIYSTSETLTNKVWIDGKPIYRKVLNVTVPTGQTGGKNISENHGISNLGTVTSMIAFSEKSEGDGYRRQIPFTYYNNLNGGWDGACAVNDTQVLFQIGSAYVEAYAGKKLYCVVEYTKTS